MTDDGGFPFIGASYNLWYWQERPELWRQQTPQFRLRLHRQWIGAGLADSLAASADSMAACWRARLAKLHAGQRRAWQKSQDNRRYRSWQWVRSQIPPGPCVYCGAASEHVDHVIPRCRGGADAVSNAVRSCAKCNYEKSGATPDEWKAWRLANGLTWPPRWDSGQQSIRPRSRRWWLEYRVP